MHWALGNEWSFETPAKPQTNSFFMDITTARAEATTRTGLPQRYSMLSTSRGHRNNLLLLDGQ